MPTITITDRPRLTGTVDIRGYEVPALCGIALSLLIEEPLVIHNVPVTQNITDLLTVVSSVGAEYSRVENTISIRTRHLFGDDFSRSEVTNPIVYSFIIGPVLRIAGEVIIPPTDYDMSWVELLGLTVSDTDKFCRITKPQQIHYSNHIPSSLFTIMGTVATETEFRLSVMAIEDETDLVLRLLGLIGVNVSRSSSNELVLKSPKRFSGADFINEINPRDAKIFAALGIISEGDLLLSGVNWTDISDILQLVEEAGKNYEIVPEGVRLFGSPDGFIAEKYSSLWLEQFDTLYGDDTEAAADFKERMKKLGADINVVVEGN